MAQAITALKASDLGLQGEDEEVLDVLDLPQLYTKPSAKILLATLDDLSSQPPSWQTTPRSGTPRSLSATSMPVKKKRKIRSEGVPQYLTRIISNPLVWIEDDGEKEKVWEAASQRLAERSGRTAMGAISRTFTIPLTCEGREALDARISTQQDALPIDDDDTENDFLHLTLYEPALTADNLGFKTWASSYLLAKRLCLFGKCWPALPKYMPILELGAGTGLVGMAAAAVLRHRVILTDLPEIVPNLERNVRANAGIFEDRGGRMSTAVLDWSDPAAFRLPRDNEQCPSHHFPLILAADPVYSSEHPQMLLQAIDQHLGRDKDCKVIVEIPVREGFGAERQNFRDRMTRLGLDIVQEGEEVGYDDWSDGRGEEGEEKLAEVRCWWSVWGWR